MFGAGDQQFQQTTVPPRPQYWVAWALLVAGLVLTLIAWRSAEENATSQARSRFDARADELQSAIEARLAGYSQALRGVQATIGATGHPDFALWQRIYRTLDVEASYPGIVGIVYIRDTPAAELGAATALAARGAPGFAVRPPGLRDHYAIVTQVEPRTPHNLKVLGADSWAHPERRRTLEAARDFGDTRITGKLALVIDTEPEPQPGFLMYRPIYRDGVTPETTAERRAALLGYVAIGFRIRTLMEGTIGRPPRDIALTVYDSAAPSPEHEFYRSTPAHEAYRPTFRRDATISVNGRLWSLRYETLPAFDAESGIGNVQRLLVGGILISLLLFAVAWALLGTRAHALRLATGMTRALRESEAKLRAIFAQAPIAVWTVDRDGNILEGNDKLAEFVGAPVARVIGFNMVHDALDKSLAAPIQRAIQGETVQFESAYTSTAAGRVGYYRFYFQPVSVDGEFAFVLAFADDISERKEAEAHIEYLAHHDLLTGLANRVVLQDRLTQAIAAAGRTRRRLALLYLDLDHFKVINDTLGHSVGDALLIEIALRLRESLRESDTLARIGGDEFVVLLTHVDEAGDCARIADKLVETVAMPVHIEGHRLDVSVSIGIAVWPDDGSDAETLRRNADVAMYAAKARGRNGYQFFTAELNQRTRETLAMEAALRLAFERDEFLLHYQPQIDAATGSLVGAEALIRWQHPAQGLVPPGRFIPVAEERGLIDRLGDWVLHAACRQMAAWQRAGLPLVPVAVNISALQFRRGALRDSVLAALAESGVDARHLVLEITESAVMEDLPSALALLDELRALGVSIEIDDFGTGHSSLAALKRLPIHRLKIDQSFVRDVPGDADDEAIVRAVISLAASLRLQVIAEGVETVAQQQFLLDNGCTQMQGYLYARPEPAESFAARLPATP